MGSAWSRSKSTYDPTPVFKTKYGKIRGKRYHVGANHYVNVFISIPYAKPPTGVLRFKKPCPPESWPNVRECIQNVRRVPEREAFLGRWSTGNPSNEDCLYLNVYAPEWDPFGEQKSGRAVMIWINDEEQALYPLHPSVGCSGRGICKYLCSRDVIVVSVHYRHGILGFVATADQYSTPNLGIWDQVMAINWVKENIAEFGGDPYNITLFGHGAGAVFVDILSISPYTRDSFDKMILMSGTADCKWALHDIRRVKQATIAHACSLGWHYPENASEEDISASLMRFLRHQCATSLTPITTGYDICKSIITSPTPFGAVFDGDLIPESITELRKKTPKKTCLCGVTEYEALIFGTGCASVRSLCEDIISIVNLINCFQMEDCIHLFSNGKRTSGFGRKSLDMTSFDHLLNVIIPQSNDHPSSHLFSVAKSLYINDAYSSNEMKRAYVKRSPLPASTHGSDLAFLFGKSPSQNIKRTAADRMVIENLTTLFTNLAKFGDVNGSFIEGLEALNEYDKWSYVSIGRGITMKCNFHDRRANFWRRLRENRLHLPNVEANSIQTQTDPKLLTAKRYASTIQRRVHCQQTQTDANLQIDLSLSELHEVAMRSRESLNDSENLQLEENEEEVDKLEIMKSQTDELNEEDIERCEEIAITITLTKGERGNSLDLHEAEIIFFAWMNEANIRPYDTESHKGGDGEDSSLGRLEVHEETATDDQSLSVLFYDEMLYEDYVKICEYFADGLNNNSSFTPTAHRCPTSETSSMPVTSQTVRMNTNQITSDKSHTDRLNLETPPSDRTTLRSSLPENFYEGSARDTDRTVW
ncbi:unnamed protein product [Anisakis simplex]|uniref:COesterase domain-containing protein n=1 Tax=Anisakis simplex TaxID=6269 RepID=A0A0M3JUM7_ANISI|nr:unnamed protein product [Anisakis simplex]